MIFIPKEVEIGNLTYELNESNKTARITGHNPSETHFYVPPHITYESQEYVISSVGQKSFYHSKSIISIEFSPDSQVRTFERKSFACSSLEEIIIPKSVTRICFGTFLCCSNLCSIEFEEDSELETIEEDVFLSSGICHIYSLPSTMKNFEIGWCSGAHRLIEIDVFERKDQNPNPSMDLSILFVLLS